MSHKKIFFVLPSLLGGGAEKFIIRLANALAGKGFNITILLLTNSHDDYLDEIDSKITLLHLNKHDGMRSLIPLASLFRKYKPDIIFSTMTLQNVLCIAAKLLSGINAKVFVRPANMFSEYDRPKDKQAQKFAKFLYPLASGIIFLSHDVYNEHVKRGIKNKKMTVIYNFVDKENLQQLAAKPCDLPLNFANPLIVAAGRLHPKKNYAYLIRGFHVFCQQYDYPNAKLIILGKGQEQAKLEQLIQELNLQDRVILKGFYKNPYPYFAHADLFVHTSKVEGLCNVLLAALALEVNIVATDCPAPLEILANGMYGRLIPRTDTPNVLARTMYDALQNPIDKQLLAQSVQSLSVEKIVQQYIEFMGLTH